MTAPNWDTISLATGSGGDQHGDMHGRTLGMCENVKAYGATGDGSTDDTTAIQAAIDVAQAFGGTGHVFFPRGTYIVSSTLTLDGYGVRLSSATGSDENYPNGSPGAFLKANIATPILQRTDTNEKIIVIEDMGLQNSGGTAIDLAGLEAPSGVFRCRIKGKSGVVFGTNCFNASVTGCKIVGLGTYTASSRGVSFTNHCHMFQSDITTFSQGIYINGSGCAIAGARIETNQTGIYLDGAAGASIMGATMEANDTGITFSGVGNATVGMIHILGSANAPSGGSLIGLDFASCGPITVSSVKEAGSHSTAFVRMQNATFTNVTFVGVFATSGWTFAGSKAGVTAINCTGMNDIVRAPEIATASLPAAAAGEDGRLVIEDNGAGDQNLILYANGERYRIDGGAAF